MFLAVLFLYLCCGSFLDCGFLFMFIERFWVDFVHGGVLLFVVGCSVG